MKKFVLVAILVCGSTVSVLAKGGDKNSVSPNNVPNLIIDNFTSNFKNATNVQWSSDNRCEKAAFVVGKTNYNAFYSLDGTFLGVTRDITFDKIPAVAQTEIKKEYKDFIIGKVIKLIPNPGLENFDELGQQPIQDSVYFVDVKNNAKEYLLQVNTDATVSFFKEL